MKKKSIETFEFMDNKFNVDKNIVFNHIFYLICIGLLSYIGCVLFNLFILGSIDYYDLRIYILQSIQIINGNLPYISTSYAYPVLSLVPMILSVLLAIFINNLKLSIVIFQLFMIFCNIITILCVYFIVLKLYNDKVAFKAGILYAISIVALYTTLTRFDALPVCLMIMSITLFMYNKYRDACIFSFIGFFVKIFPIITYPFFIAYQLKNGHEKIKYYLVIFVGLVICLLLPFQIIIGWIEGLKPYTFAVGSSISSIYANTFTYACHFLLFDIMKLPISIDMINNFFIFIFIIMLGVLYVTYRRIINFTYTNMIFYICILISLLIIISKFHSPQYFMWITPLLVILSINDIKKIICFIIFQILTFIEFPLMFGRYYTNVNYIHGAELITCFFFLLEYGILILLLYLCAKDIKLE